MPSSWLNVPHFQQELEFSCVPACLRMVLAHQGDMRAEADLRLLLETKPTGTRAGNIMRLSGDAFEIHLRSSNVAELQKALSDNQPPIVFLKTGSLEYWKMDIFHTVVGDQGNLDSEQLIQIVEANIVRRLEMELRFRIKAKVLLPEDADIM